MVAVTSGASVPDHLVRAVIAHLQNSGFPTVAEHPFTKESLTFALPPEVR